MSKATFTVDREFLQENNDQMVELMDEINKLKEKIKQLETKNGELERSDTYFRDVVCRQEYEIIDLVLKNKEKRKEYEIICDVFGAGTIHRIITKNKKCDHD